MVPKMFKKLLTYAAVTAALLSGVDAAAQGSLSAQVLRLLSRENTWTDIQHIDAPSGGVLLLTRQSTPLALRTDRLENIGGNLYFNGALLQSSAASGTVTSVDVTLPAIFSVTGGPITSSGTIAATLATQSANRVWAGPTTGAAAAPTFRALVAADIPDISATYVTPAGAAALSNKTGLISQWTNDSGYLTSSTTGSTSITTLGTVVTGTWNAGVVAGQYGGTGVANTGKTITLGGNLTTSGAFNTTLTTTANTNVTLPTSGTLVNSGVTTLSSLVSVGTISTGVWNGTAIGAVYGGTGQTTVTTGDLLYGSAANVWSKLAGVATGNVLLSGGVGVAPAWGKVNLTSAVTGVLPAANGGLATNISAATNGQLLIGRTSDNTMQLATLTGTADQVVVTNGAASITLSTPQSINTTSTPRFARLGLGTGAGATAVITTTGVFDTGYFDNGNSGVAATITWTAGMVQKITLNNNTTLTFNGPTNGVAQYRLDLIQDGTGSRLVTWPGTVTWKGGAAPTLTTTAGKTDICFFRWNGSVYFGECSLNY